MFEQLQRTQAWHAQRRGRITGSQAGALLGQSPYVTQAQAVRAWVRNYHDAPSEIADNPAFAWGRNHEREAILALMKATGVTVNDAGFCEYGDWLGASPDGITDCGAVVEVKVPFGLRKDEYPKFKPLRDQPHYYTQVQLEMLCSRKRRAIFAQYRPAFGDSLGGDYAAPALTWGPIERDDDWLGKYISKLREIYAMLQDEISNPAHLAPLRVSLDENPEALRLLKYIDELGASIEAATEAKAEALGKLVKLANSQDAEIRGRKLTLVCREGSISYAKAIKELVPGADLEKWRGESSESWRLS